MVLHAALNPQAPKGLQLASIPYASSNRPHDLQNPSIILISILMHGALNLNKPLPILSSPLFISSPKETPEICVRSRG